MSITLTKPKRLTEKRRLQQKIRELQQQGIRIPSHTPNYINLLPPGRVLAEKIFEMGIDAAELARRMELPVETIEQLLRFEIPLTQEVADKIQEVTWMNAGLMMKHETSYREGLAFAMEHPEIPAYLGGEIINRPKRKGVRRQELER